jgi:hypothetical protein
MSFCPCFPVIQAGPDIILMQNTPYYISNEFIAEIKGEEMLERYPNVEVLIEYPCIYPAT